MLGILLLRWLALALVYRERTIGLVSDWVFFQVHAWQQKIGVQKIGVQEVE